MMVQACKCMSGRLGGYLGVADSGTGLLWGRATVEAQGIQRRPRKIHHDGGQLLGGMLGDVRGCGTRASAPFSFFTLFFLLLFLSLYCPALCSHNPQLQRHLSQAVGRGHSSTLAPPVKVRRFTSAATLKTQTRCRSQCGRLHRLRVALDMLP